MSQEGSCTAWHTPVSGLTQAGASKRHEVQGALSKIGTPQGGHVGTDHGEPELCLCRFCIHASVV